MIKKQFLCVLLILVAASSLIGQEVNLLTYIYEPYLKEDDNNLGDKNVFIPFSNIIGALAYNKEKRNEFDTFKAEYLTGYKMGIIRGSSTDIYSFLIWQQ